MSLRLARCMTSLVALLLLAPGRIAHAQERLHFGLGAGLHAVVGGDAAGCAGGRNARALIAHKLPTPHLTVRLDGQYLHHVFEPTYGPGTFRFGPPPAEDAVAGFLELQWSPAPTRGVRPYIVAGPGVAGARDDGFGNSRARFAWTAGTGVRLRLGVAAAFAEADFVHIGTAKRQGVPTGLATDLFLGRDMVPVTVGIVL